MFLFFRGHSRFIQHRRMSVFAGEKISVARLQDLQICIVRT